MRAAEPELIGLNARSWQQELEQRATEVESALDRFVQEQRADEELRLVISLPNFWMATGRVAKEQAMLERALASSGESTAAHRARTHFRAGLLAFWRGEDETATASFEAALETGRAEGLPTEVSIALTGLARLALRSR